MNIIEWRDSLYESNLSYKAKLVGAILSQFYRVGNPTYPAVRTLSQLTSLTINPVQDGLAELEREGFISRKQERIKGNKYLSNIYTFIDRFNKAHVSPRDTSRDDTSRDDTSYDTSYDTSRGDTEVVEVDEVNINKRGCEKLNQLSKKDMETWLMQMEMQGTPININVESELQKMKAHFLAYNGLDKNGNRVFDWVNKAKTWLLTAQTNHTTSLLRKPSYNQKPQKKERLDLKVGDRI